MKYPFAWETDLNPNLIGNYRNVPTVGSRQPFFENKEYAPHYNLEMIMASHIDIFNNQLKDIDETVFEKLF